MLSAFSELLEKIHKKVDIVSKIMSYASGIILFLAILLVSVEVILRKFFSISMGGADELSSYALAFCISMTLSYALLHKGHIRIDIVYAKLPQKAKNFLDLISLVSLLIFMFPLTYFSFEVFSMSLDRNSTANTPLQTPLWIPQGLWVAGFIIFCFVICLLILMIIVKTLNNEHDKLSDFTGIATLEEEIEEETGIHLEKQ